MADYYTVPNSLSTTEMGSYARKVCFPLKVNCSPTCGLFLKGINDFYNCTYERPDYKYLNPYIDGDKLFFVTRFKDEYNSEPTNPLIGWGQFMKAEIIDFSGAVVPAYADFSSFASRYLVGHSGSFSYQLIEIDTNLIQFDNFRVRFSAYNISNVLTEELYSEPFQKQVSCENLTLISSTYTGVDCCGNYYGLPATDDGWVGNELFSFSNQLRIPAKLYRETGTVAYEKFNNNTTESTFVTPYTLRLSRPVPLYVSDWILRIVFSGQDKFINGDNYLVDDLSPDNKKEKGTMQLYDIEVYNTCENDFFCN